MAIFFVAVIKNQLEYYNSSHFTWLSYFLCEYICSDIKLFFIATYEIDRYSKGY